MAEARRPLRPDARRRSRLRGCIAAFAVALGALAAPAAALAVDPPTVLTAGVNANDELYATWSVAAGTTFDFVTFATVPDPDPTLPEFFTDNNFAGFCDAAHPSATCTATSYTAGYPLVRDRRYFMKVVAKVGTTNTYVTSQVWVIDDAKPQVPGNAPVSEAPTPTNTPVAGHPLGTVAPPPPPVGPPPPPPPAAPAAALKILTPPKTFAALLTKGVKVQVGCTVTCSAFGRLTLGSPTIGTKSLDLTGGGLKTLTVKLSSAGRKRLRGRSRARIKIAVAVSPFGGATKKASKSFTVKR